MSFQTQKNDWDQNKPSPTEKRYEEMYRQAEEFIKEQGNKRILQAGR